MEVPCERHHHHQRNQQDRVYPSPLVNATVAVVAMSRKSINKLLGHNMTVKKHKRAKYGTPAKNRKKNSWTISTRWSNKRFGCDQTGVIK